jgi:hypothetical protein
MDSRPRRAHISSRACFHAAAVSIFFFGAAGAWGSPTCERRPGAPSERGKRMPPIPKAIRFRYQLSVLKGEQHATTLRLAPVDVPISDLLTTTRVGG